MASEKIVTVTSTNFDQEVLQSTEPVMVDFWAEWCGPCKMVAPTLDQLADEMSGKVKIAKLNIDQYQDVAYKFGVQSIPTFILFKNGQVADRMLGAMPKAGFQSFLTRNL